MNPKNKFLDFLQPKNVNKPLYAQSSSPIKATPIQGRVPGEQGFEITGGGRTNTPPASTAPSVTAPKPTSAVVPNASATNPVASSPSTLSPAGKEFASQLPVAGTNLSSNFFDSPNNPPAGSSTPPPTSNPTQNTPPTAPSATDTAFAEYIKSLQPSGAVSTAQSAYNTAVADQSKSYAGFEGQGRGIASGLIRGQQEKYLRQTQPELARLQGEIGIAQEAEKGIQDIGKAKLDFALGKEKKDEPIEVGGVLYNKEADGTYKALTGTSPDKGFTLGKDQSRFEYDSATGTYKNVAGGQSTQTGNGAYTKGTDPTADAYADAVLNGKTKLENIPEEYRGAVAQAISGVEVTPETSPYLAQIAVQGKQAVVGLKEIAARSPGIFGRTAAAPIPDMFRSDDFRNYKAQLDYLRGNLIPASLTAMREASKTGGALGQVSDREGAWLASALGALSMSQEASEVVKQLGLIEESLGRWEKAVNQYGETSGSSTGGDSLYSW